MRFRRHFLEVDSRGARAYHLDYGRLPGKAVTTESNDHWVKIVRRAARIWAGLSVALVAFIFAADAIAEGIDPIRHLSSRETVMMAALAGAWLGLILGWKWELAGGILSVCGMAAFYLADFAFSGSFPRGPFFLILIAPAILFIYCGLKKRNRSTPVSR